MKVYIMKDEWYPVFVLDDSFGAEFEVTSETKERWESVFMEFNKVQREMRRIYDGADQ